MAPAWFPQTLDSRVGMDSAINRIQTTNTIMMPLDPVQPANTTNSKPMAPPYVDDDPNQEMVEKGLRIAENEKRDAVTDSYEKEALSSDDSQESLDDIAYPGTSDNTGSPELSAMRTRSSPSS